MTRHAAMLLGESCSNPTSTSESWNLGSIRTALVDCEVELLGTWMLQFSVKMQVTGRIVGSRH